MQPGTCLPVTPSRSRATGRTVTCEQGRIRIPSTRGALFSGPFDFRNPLKTGLSYVDKCVLFLAVVAELPERYHPRDLADAHRIINELWAEIEELRRQRTADDRDMVALKERNEEVVSKHNDNIERWRDLVETHNDLVSKHNELIEADDEYVDRLVADERKAIRWREKRVEQRLDKREVELAAREAILKKRYGTGQPRGRPPSYAPATVLEVRKLHEMGRSQADIVREIGLLTRFQDRRGDCTGGSSAAHWP